jgi:hypothetical protein
LATALSIVVPAATAHGVEIHQHTYVDRGPLIREVQRVVHVAPPDSDDDGLANADDECPNVSAATDNGCPPPAPSVQVIAYSDAPYSGDSANGFVDPFCESSGDSQVVDSSGTYWGKYQYDRPSWADDGGDPASYGSASEAEQDAVAANATIDRWPNC